MATKRYVSDHVLPPGKVLAEELEARGWSQGELARRMGYSRQTVTDLIHARRSLTPALAQALGSALGTSAQLWLNLEATYRSDLERRERIASNPLLTANH